jgi:hypothetical protein
MDRLPAFNDFGALELVREKNGMSLALLRPTRVIRLDITFADSPIWTDEELDKLLQEQKQGNLFDQEQERKHLATLKKLPFDFHYEYACETPAGEKIYRHKIVDWEVGALFWNCKRSHGEEWEAPFRSRLEVEFAKKDCMFMMGNLHRFQHQWLIISLMYPPMPKLTDVNQQGLF